MALAARTLGAALADIVGRDRWADDGATLAAAAVDGRPPRWLVRPAGPAHVGGVLALAAEAGLAVVVRGSGSALDLGRPPARVDVVLDVSGLDRILADHPDDLTITVEAGLTAGALDRHLAAHGQWLPLDPPGWPRRTLGGLAATRASGPLRARHGTLRDLLLGVRFVQPDGTPTWGGARVVKSVSGYDIPKLMVGALGTLGVLVELTLRLHPRPPVEATWLARLGGPQAAQALVAALLDSTVEATRLEFLDGGALAAVGAPPGPAAVAVSIGSVAGAVAEQGERLVALARAAGGTVEAADAAFWARWDRAFRPQPHQTRLAVASLPDRLADTVAAIRGGLARLEAPATLTGCAALGTFRLVVTGGEAVAMAGLVEALRGAVAPWGGGVTVQGGPPGLRALVDPWGPVEPGVQALMRALRDEFDPRRVLNPGRLGEEL